MREKSYMENNNISRKKRASHIYEYTYRDNSNMQWQYVISCQWSPPLKNKILSILWWFRDKKEAWEPFTLHESYPQMPCNDVTASSCWVFKLESQHGKVNIDAMHAWNFRLFSIELLPPWNFRVLRIPMSYLLFSFPGYTRCCRPIRSYKNFLKILRQSWY